MLNPSFCMTPRRGGLVAEPKTPEKLHMLFRGRLNSGVERETGFEPATSTLARLHSTAELFPRNLQE